MWIHFHILRWIRIIKEGVVYLERSSYNDSHHDQRVSCGEHTGEKQLPAGLADEADYDVDDDGDQVIVERKPVGDLEGSHEGSHQHEENRTRTNDGTAHQHDLRNINQKVCWRNCLNLCFFNWIFVKLILNIKILKLFFESHFPREISKCVIHK